ncbi:MAG: ATP-dependent DNA ligase [Acidimicrobiales bacterium]
MQLPVMPPVSPMLAKLSREMPEGEGLLYEPKWDGFRCIVFRDGAEVELGSRNERPLTRYFPELVGPMLANLPDRCVLDGEIVIAGPTGLDFDALLQRIHPADSRIKLLASSTPASFVAFDMLASGEKDMRPEPFATRRCALEEALLQAEPPVYLTPATSNAGVARDWFSRFEGAGLDGVVAKPLALGYREGERVMLKLKHERTADCVVGGFRWHKDGGGVGSLLLGLYDEQGVLHHVGVASGFSVALRKSLVGELSAYRVTEPHGHPWEAMAPKAEGARRPGSPSRWNAGKDLSWEPLAPELVCEVSYDHLQGDRFRHATSFRRWRPEREPRSCSYSQLEAAVPEELSRVFGALS